MPRDLSRLFVQEANKQEQSQLFRLVTINVPNETSLYIVDSNHDVVFDGITYQRFPMKFSEISITSDGAINKASVTVANPERVIQAIIERNNGLKNAIVNVKSVYARFIDHIITHTDSGWDYEINPEADASEYIEDEYVVDSYTSTESVIVIQLNPVIDTDVKTPRRRFNRNCCSFTYKDPDTCGYTGPHANEFCPKTLEACKFRGNQKRFGGFPGIPAGTRRFFI